MFSIRHPLYLVSLAACFLFVVPVVQADMLSGSSSLHTIYFKFLNDTDNNGWHYASPQVTENLSTGQIFNSFCVDRAVMTSTDYANSEVGQAYQAVALDSAEMTLYSQAQKNALNSLFSHVYTSIIDAEGNYIDSYQSLAFQLAVWEIVGETSGVWSITDGSFGISNAAKYNEDRTSSTVDATTFKNTTDLVNSWFAALADPSLWTTAQTDLELTVYVADGGTHVSQTLISTVAPTSVTPEPAGILIFGMGLLALPVARRLRNRNLK